MLSDTGIEVRIRHRMGTLDVDVEFDTGSTWTVLFGPSGSGKSTVLRVVAGLLRPEMGCVEVRTPMRRKVVLNTAGGRFVAPHKRGIRYAGQTPMLFPRMTVEENLWQAHQGPGRKSWVGTALRHFGLEPLAGKLPGELSGGQRQMVSVVRAAIGEGEILLLDEPFSGLDSKLRERLVVQMREWLGGTPVVSVTHDVGEAFLLGADVIRMQEGRIVGQGFGYDVLAEERQRLFGMLG